MRNEFAGSCWVTDSTSSFTSLGTSPGWEDLGTLSLVSPLPGMRDRVEDLKLRQRLERFDSAQSPEERAVAQRAILALGAAAIPSVLAELSLPQPPDRLDVLVALLVRREPGEVAVHFATERGATPALRMAMAEALARYAASAPPALRAQIASALRQLARDRDVAVRSTAIDAIGLAGIADEPEVHELLQSVAEADADPDTRAEARAILDELE